jgi:hypothetical protein
MGSYLLYVCMSLYLVRLDVSLPLVDCYYVVVVWAYTPYI